MNKEFTFSFFRVGIMQNAYEGEKEQKILSNRLTGERKMKATITTTQKRMICR